ncbi:MAG: flagellar hook-basal body protein [Actinomycetota bacterium]|nr:flagellar hook-basal body protein [Actinomycetota bacterium]
MAAQQQRLAALSNDLANVNTTGYKRVRVAFRDLVYTPAGPGTTAGIQEGAGAAATSVGRGAAQGAIHRTDRRLDVAVDGPGFIRARGANGEQVLTRDGALNVDANGRLMTSSGHHTGVTLRPGTSEGEITIARDGTVSDGERTVGRLDLVVVRATDGLQANGDNTFSLTTASGAASAGDVRVEQGALEMSNVDVADAMADMIEAQRSFELASRAIRMQDQLMEIANGVKR